MSFKNVKIYHGLSTSFHSLEHKPQKLNGLKNRLQKLGFRVVLAEVPYINFCMIEMCGYEVFRCNLKHLKFNAHYTRDAIAQRAITVVLETSAKMCIARKFLWFNSLIYHEMFTKGPYAPKDYWPLDVQVQPYTTCNECVACCDILVTRQEMKAATPSICFKGDQ